MNKEELENRSRYIRICYDSDVPLTVDLQTHKVVGWKEEFGSKSIFEKVVDMGVYTLLDENKEEIYCIEGYVPNDFLPEKDGYGDYLTLNIAKDGIVTNWYENPDFQEFIEQGYSTSPVTSEENISNAINSFLLPLAKRINEKLLPYVKDRFFNHKCLPELSMKPDDTYNCLILELDETYNRRKSDYMKYLRMAKSMWLEFYANDPVSSRQCPGLFDIWTDIELAKDHIYVKAIDKNFTYTNLPGIQDIEQISDLFKFTLEQMIQGKMDNRKHLGQGYNIV